MQALLTYFHAAVDIFEHAQVPFWSVLAGWLHAVLIVLGCWSYAD